MWEEREKKRLQNIETMKQLDELKEKIKRDEAERNSIENIKKELQEKEERWKRAIERKGQRERGEEIIYTEEEKEEMEARKRLEHELRMKAIDEKYFGGAEAEREAKEYERFMRDDGYISSPELERIKNNYVKLTKEERERRKKILKERTEKFLNEKY
jgi:hypothetical protein